MDELVDILDENGNYIGKSVLKSEAHKKGLFHPTVHIWCYSQKSKVLLQQRGKNKKTHPLKWDVSVAGHIAAGESIELAAEREIAEEIGVNINPLLLEKLGVFKTEKRHSPDLFDREFNYTFLYPLSEEIPIRKQESEVEALEWVLLDDFEKMFHLGHPDLVENSEERYSFIVTSIKSRL